nr:T9SS type A sorting domain-containing protein [Chitinophagaceae bacterium]
WFGSTSFGPTNDDLQEQNVKTILQNIGSDIYGLTEVVDTARLGRVVRQMPGYSYIVGNFGSRVNPPDPTGGPISEAQKLAFVYKTAMFKNITTRPLINNQNVSSTSYNNWSSGRYPFLMTADVTLNCVTKKINFILIHAKANTSPTATSYARRQASANELHDTLVAYFPNDNIIVLGDFNDDLDQSITAGFTTTSYSSFTTDNTNFFSPTLALSLAGKKSTVSYNDVIDHVILSNDIQPDYMSSTATILTDVASLVSNYGKTTTDHYPVFTRYQFKNTNPPVVTIRDAFAINAGGQPNTVYLGYSPASTITLTSNVTGGTPAYSYMWSTGALTSGVTVSPVVNTTYTLTVTDANGCTATANKSIVVVNVAGIKNAGNVMICHNTNGQMSTLEVEQNTVAAHLAHGDLLGGCSTSSSPSTHIFVTALPNPSTNYFTITIEGGDPLEPVNVRVLNTAGKIIEHTLTFTKSFRLGANYMPGLYFLQVRQKFEKHTIKLLKQ